jgi:hypothetical protein
LILENLIESPQVSDAITIENLVYQVIKFKRYSENIVIDLLVLDAIQHSISLQQKQLLRAEVANAHEKRLVCQISFCIALARSFPENTELLDTKLLQQMDEDLTWIDWNLSLIQRFLVILETTLKSPDFPIHLDKLQWVELWSSILFVRSASVPGAINVLLNHQFLKSFFLAYPRMKAKISPSSRFNRIVPLAQKPKSSCEISAVIFEIFLTGLSKAEECDIDALLTLPCESFPELVSVVTKTAKKMVGQESFDAAEKLINFLKFKLLLLSVNQPIPPQFQDLEASILLARVVSHLSLLDPLLHMNDIQMVSNQLLESTHAAVPPNIKAFSKLIGTLVSKEQSQTALKYIQKIKSVQKPNVSMSIAMFNLGRIMILINTIKEFLKSIGVTLEIRDSLSDREKLHCISDSLINEFISFASQLTIWIGGEETPEMIYEVHDHLIDYLKSYPPGIWDVILGLIGGNFVQKFPEKQRIDPESLGIYCVFSVSGNYNWQSVGCKGLETRIPIPDGFTLTDSGLQTVTSFLMKCCSSTVRIQTLKNARTYRLLGDLYHFQNKKQKAIVSYLDSVLLYSEDSSERITEYITGSVLDRLVQLALELNGICNSLESLDVIFFLQFYPSIDYERAFALLNDLDLHSLSGELELYVDPPTITKNTSPLFCIYDVYLLERIISNFYLS